MPKPKRRLRLAAAAVAALAVAVTAAAQSMPTAPPRFRLGLTAGWGHSFAEWGSIHRSLSTAPFFFRISGDNSIVSKAKSALFAGASLSFTVGRRWAEFQAGFGYLKSPFPSDVRYELSYVREHPGALEKTWTGTGEVTSVPLYLDFINRFTIGKTRLGVVFFVGPAIFLNAALAETFGGAPGLDGRGNIDVVKVPVVVEDKTWVGLGGNIGAGLELPVGRNMNLALEAVYFYCPRKSLPWKWVPGTYDGMNGVVLDFVFSENAAVEATSDTTALTVKPSFLAVTLGLKIVFR